VLTPIAFLAGPSPVSQPIDLALGFIIPFHAHIGLNYVISDYVPKASRSIARGATAVGLVIITLGLLKLNISGPGITDTIKELWRKPKSKSEVKN
jgi:succinate dehydrogenase (ubiquinone) membrane anchor subunit